MSFERGWQALHLDMPDRIPHTEYVSHPDWVKRLTGLDPRVPDEAAEASLGPASTITACARSRPPRTCSTSIPSK